MRWLERALAALPEPTAEWLIHALYRMPGFTRVHLACPVCGARPDWVEHIAPLSPLDRCPRCTHVFARRSPGKLVLQLIYRNLGYWRQDKEHQGIDHIAYGPQWDGFIRSRIEPMKQFGALGEPPQRVFEIGCSEGMLLHALKRAGYEVLGCDVNAPTAESGAATLGVPIRVGLFEELDLPAAHYDVVASFHTIEHLTDLDRTFAAICRILKPGGAVFIEVPTGPEEYGNRDHVQFFSEASLQRLLARYFEVAEIQPNRYTTTHGVHIGALFGVGRGVRPSPLPIQP